MSLMDVEVVFASVLNIILDLAYNGPTKPIVTYGAYIDYT